MSNVVGDIVEGVVDSFVDPGVDDLIVDAATSRKRFPWGLLLFVLGCLGLALGGPMLLGHVWNADRDQLTVLTFETPEDRDWRARIVVDRQVPGYENAWNAGESISGPYPSLAIFEGHAEGLLNPVRPVRYRIIEAVGIVPARFRTIPEEPEDERGLFDRLTGIGDERVDRYMEAAAVEMERAGYPTIARALRERSMTIGSIDHGVFSSTLGILGAGCLAMSLMCFVGFGVVMVRRTMRRV
jgi:hypothetical protein